MLAGEQLSGTTKASGDFIKDQENIVLAAIDETLAARKPVLAWKDGGVPGGKPAMSEQGGR